MASEKIPLSYKGHPLRRKDNLIYYGTMAEKYIIMLQILDDGRITDSQGRTVDFKNTVIVMTSNIGAKALTDARSRLGFETDDEKAEADALTNKQWLDTIGGPTGSRR